MAENDLNLLIVLYPFTVYVEFKYGKIVICLLMVSLMFDHAEISMMHLIICHQHQLHQEPPCPPKLLEETWRKCGVLTWLLISDLDETFTDTSNGCSLSSVTISRSIRNVHVLLDSRKRLSGQLES